ncbi:MAG TPA: transglutaminase-like domain-containing protein [Ohtaekwangia sp.]|uniref:transglutaminase-like domain-containing protein n=1 Tax=Ohtaekwangia sp. TaxID=2066019 RepID=UPI002F954447
MKKIIVSLFLLPATVLMSRAQSDDVWQQFKDKFPDEPAVFVNRSEVLNILPDGDSLKVFLDVTEDILHLKEQSDIFSGKRVYGSHFNQVANLKAKTLVWDKNRYKEMVVSDFKKNSDRSAGIFYDDSYYYSFDFPSIASHNRTQLEYRENLKDVRFVPGYVFASYLPQGKSSYTIKTTKDVELSYQVLHDDKKQIQFKKTEKGNNVIYEWSAQYMPALKSEESSPSIRYFVPHVVCYVKSYKTRKGQVNVLSNLDDLYHWYYTFVEKLNKENSPELTAIVEKIKADSKSEIETVRKVFYWVQDNIQYIAFEQGMRGLIPHSGSYVCEKRYGDCKDMANLIVNMLQIAGVKAYHTWIGTRDLPYRYTEVPTPLVDNHMIATYISKDGEYYFLDGTSDHTAFGYPSSMIQGKEALIGIDPTHYVVKEVPVIARDKNIMTDSMTIKLDGSQLTGTGISTLTGYPKVFAGYELDRSEKDDVKRYVTKLVGKGNNKFFLDKYALQAMDERDKPTRVEYDFRLSDYFQKLGDELYINLNLNKDYYNDFINIASRTSPRDVEYKYVKYEVIDLAIPDGYTVEYLPPNAKNDGSLLGCDVTYESLPGKIRCSKKFYVDFVMLEPNQFTAWNDAVKQISETYKESIILKKK